MVALAAVALSGCAVTVPLGAQARYGQVTVAYELPDLRAPHADAPSLPRSRGAAKEFLKPSNR